MALTTLDPKTALIVVDWQKGIVTYLVVHSIEQVIDRSRALIEAFRARGLPVV
ncbi:isochorismatase family protein, partial [Escherichia coli]|uniref:isochorismatase family protein n=1 Tax=Escherichia coli TaxID=562 RepID=UPI003D362A99